MPGWAQIPMVLLATVATVIASQAVISGAFSVTQQAVQLGFLPRLTIRHTSRARGRPDLRAGGQRGAVRDRAGDRDRLRLRRPRSRSAYGVAVTGTFILNTILFLAVARLLWHKPRRRIALGAVVFLTIEVDVLRGQPDQGRARRLAAAGDRGGGLRRR